MDMYEDNDAPEQKEPQGGYCIKIYVGADNQVQSVAVKQKEAEEAGESQDRGQPVQSIEEAMQAAMRIYQAGGDMQGQESPEDAAMRGYAGPSGMRKGVGLRKVFSEGM